MAHDMGIFSVTLRSGEIITPDPDAITYEGVAHPHPIAQAPAYRLEVEATGRHGSIVRAMHYWRVVEIATGRIADFGRSPNQARAYRKGNRALLRRNTKMRH